MKTLNLLFCIFICAIAQCSFAQPYSNKQIAPTASSQHVALTVNEFLWVQQHHTVTVAVRPGWMPIEYRLDGESYRGISLDYLKEISRITGLTFNLTEFNANLQETKADLILSVNERFTSKFFTITNQPYFKYSLCVVRE